MNSIGNIAHKNILLLQGPMGYFFKKLDLSFRKNSADTYRIGFNGGDWFFSTKDNYTPYKGPKEEWERFLKNFLLTNRIDMIFLFGDCRHYQSQAIQVSSDLNIEVFVFEEGYIRPHYITLEKYGVNNYSKINRNKSFYKAQKEFVIDAPIHAKQSKFKMASSAILYYLWANLLTFRYPHYEHHREFSALKEAFYGLRGLARKQLYFFTERKYPSLIKNLSKKYFLIPLQTHNDFQVLQHSNYGSIEKFIINILESFAYYGNKNDWLLFKHHPIDRGRRNYKSFIFEQAQNLHIENRIIVIHDIHLPFCIKHAKGTITINSTVGLSSIGHGIPTLTMGNAIYNIEGLTCKESSLEEFWIKQCTPDKDLYQKYKNYLIHTTQLNGSFYGLFPIELKKKQGS